MRINQVKSLPQEAPSVTRNELARVFCAQAKTLEEAGKFEDARLALGELWQRIGDRPKLDGLDEPTRGEVLLRVGALSGWIGSTRQIPGAQEIAKDLISESSAIFAQLAFTEKVAEAQVDLGICYWRQGALDEARITFDHALQQLGDLTSEQRLRAVLNKAIVEKVSSRPQEALRLLSESEPLFETSNNYSLRGKFHNELAMALQDVAMAGRHEEYIDRALLHFTAASVNFEKAGHQRFLASVENNLGFLFSYLEKFEEAYQHLDRARSLGTSLNDKGLVARSEDTRARALLAEGHVEQAEKVARRAVKTLREGDEQSSLADALTTNATAVARLGRHGHALAMFSEAVRLSVQAGDPESGGIAALKIIEELAAILSPTELRDYYLSAESALTHSQDYSIQSRLGACARSVLAVEKRASTSGSQATTTPATAASISLEEQVLRYEGELIKLALETAGGSVTRAARLLGVTHQGLAFILNGRQKNLLPSRKPAKPRRRSIIRYH